MDFGIGLLMHEHLCMCGYRATASERNDKCGPRGNIDILRLTYDRHHDERVFLIIHEPSAISSGAEGVGEHARMPRTVELNAEIEGRIERLQNAGPRSDYTFQEFTWQMLRIGLNVYEKQILPVETCGDR